MFIAATIGQVSLQEHINIIHNERSKSPNDDLYTVCLDRQRMLEGKTFFYYQDFLKSEAGAATFADLDRAERKVDPDDVINLQFTSGESVLLEYGESPPTPSD